MKRGLIKLASVAAMYYNSLIELASKIYETFDECHVIFVHYLEP